jgi:hypothetical protein
MAQAFFERHGPDDIRAESAGQVPADAVHPEVVEAMRESASTSPQSARRSSISRCSCTVRSFTMTLANRRARECLRAEVCEPAAVGA